MKHNQVENKHIKNLMKLTWNSLGTLGLKLIILNNEHQSKNYYVWTKQCSSKIIMHKLTI